MQASFSLILFWRARRAVATVLFDRPAARNAMTFAMYDELSHACRTIAATPGLRAAVFRGSGGAFVAGTDISEFAAFNSGEDGVAYERRIEAEIAEIEHLPVPTLAVVDGAAMGGGLIIATACDLRIASTRSRFGAPIASTLGNCLSIRNVARLERAFGLGAARRAARRVGSSRVRVCSHSRRNPRTAGQSRYGRRPSHGQRAAHHCRDPEVDEAAGRGGRARR
jgi:enoyl-CoA hydratase